ncbi:hypothetical protein [Streptomyces sp. NPDC006446]|uniref:hypothetical protein n=1 Tax=Streptomyces sp. NPDC006446 TaxID=3154301 RepID=UPI0033B0B3D2
MVLNAAVLWTTRYQDAAVEESTTSGTSRYSFRVSAPVDGGLRPLRDPSAAGLDDEWSTVRCGYCPDVTSAVGVFGGFGVRLDM